MGEIEQKEANKMLRDLSTMMALSAVMPPLGSLYGNINAVMQTVGTPASAPTATPVSTPVAAPAPAAPAPAPPAPPALAPQLTGQQVVQNARMQQSSMPQNQMTPYFGMSPWQLGFMTPTGIQTAYGIANSIIKQQQEMNRDAYQNPIDDVLNALRIDEAIMSNEINKRTLAVTPESFEDKLRQEEEIAKMHLEIAKLGPKQANQYSSSTQKQLEDSVTEITGDLMTSFFSDEYLKAFSDDVPEDMKAMMTNIMLSDAPNTQEKIVTASRQSLSPRFVQAVESLSSKIYTNLIFAGDPNAAANTKALVYDRIIKAREAITMQKGSATPTGKLLFESIADLLISETNSK